MTLLPDNQQVK